MARMTKRKKLFAEKVQPGRYYPIDEALALARELATAKFRESIEVAVNLGVDPRKSDQVVRGSTVLPNGTGKDGPRGRVRAGRERREGAGRRRRHRRLRGPRPEGQGRFPRVRRRDRLAGRDAGGRPARPDPRPARPDAEPEGRHGDAGRRDRREERQGGQVRYRTDKAGIIHCAIGKAISSRAP
jgi:large subunit ribosomal protein L1